jgi:hypothetical protein
MNTATTPRKPRGSAPAPNPATTPPAEPVQLAKIYTLVTGVKAKGFTFGPKQTVPGVPLKHAEYLKDKGEAEILEVY